MENDIEKIPGKNESSYQFDRFISDQSFKS